MFPEELRYTATHEWVRLEEDIATVGITAHAAELLGDVTYVELPEVGRELAKEEVLGTVESVKAAADLISPIGGVVVEVNDAVVENPDLIGEGPYDVGWLVKLTPSDVSQLQSLMTAQAYQAHVQTESGEREG